MRLLFTMDKGDAKKGGTAFIRPSARCINIRNNQVAMVYSPKFDYYKFPGGGIEEGETKTEALMRETLEEAGLKVIPESIKFYGYVHRIERDSTGEYDNFVQDNYYYFCKCLDVVAEQHLDLYEYKAGFMLLYVDYKTAVECNLCHDHMGADQGMLERDARVLGMLHEEGYLI